MTPQNKIDATRLVQRLKCEDAGYWSKNKKQRQLGHVYVQGAKRCLRAILADTPPNKIPTADRHALARMCDLDPCRLEISGGILILRRGQAAFSLDLFTVMCAQVAA